LRNELQLLALASQALHLLWYQQSLQVCKNRGAAS
jgi:hypothetical protein